MKRNKFHSGWKASFILLMVFTAFIFTGCSKEAAISSGDGSITIKYSSAGVFQRSPVFTESEGVIHMSFNGYEWYTAQIITEDQRDALTGGLEVLAESSNMKVYDTSGGAEDEYRFTYIFELAGTGSCIRFDTDQAPTPNGGYGNDFTEGVQYFANGTEVIPDIPVSDTDFYAGEEAQDMIKLDDIFSAAELIGKSYEECGLQEKPSNAGIKTEGSFFEIPVNGYSWFTPDDQGIPRLERVDFSIEDSCIDDFYDQLADLYGGPSAFGEEPYSEVNGGAREWYEFDAGAALVKISQGSNEDYVYLKICQNQAPGYTGSLILSHVDPVLDGSMQMKALQYENGILTVAITNRSKEAAAYSDQYVLAKRKEGETGYGSLTRIREQSGDPKNSNIYEIGAGETQKFACDLRVFGKVEPGEYMLLLDDMQTTFELAEE